MPELKKCCAVFVREFTGGFFCFLFSRPVNHPAAVHDDGRRSDEVLFIQRRYGPHICPDKKRNSLEVSIDQSIDQLATVQSNNQKMRVVHNPVYPLFFSSFEQSNNFKVLTYTVEKVLWFCLKKKKKTYQLSDLSTANYWFSACIMV